MTKPTKLEVLLLQFSIFLLPTNLAYHWISDQAYVSGKLVDYLIPKLYLSDLPILLLLLIWVYKKHKFNVSKRIFILIIWYLLVAVRGLNTPHPLASLWFVAKIGELGLLTVYLINSYKPSVFLQKIRVPLSMALLAQGGIGLGQFILQRSLVGYYLGGEPSLTVASNVAKASLGGALKILPYGTTPHPNVLAGFLGTGILLLLLSVQNSVTKRYGIYMNITFILAISLSIGVIILSNSITAGVATIGGLLLILVKKLASNKVYKVITSLLIASTLISTVILMNIKQQSKLPSDNASIYRRYELVLIADKLIFNHSLAGIGPNQFTAYLPQFSPVTAETSFLQPVHNIYLLYGAEIGILGLLPLLLAVKPMWSKARLVSPSLYIVPLLCLLLIGTLDHYPLSLQTGQILLSIATFLAIASYSHKS